MLRKIIKIDDEKCNGCRKYISPATRVQGGASTRTLTCAICHLTKQPTIPAVMIAPPVDFNTCK